jgi:hypothetical protein
MERTKNYDVTVGSGILGIFQSQSYKLERVIAEFIDNSLQSYLDHEKELKDLMNVQSCEVNIIWNDSYISVTDNAYGMNDEEFGRALKLKSYNPKGGEKDRLSVYGMGLKYAAAYLGNMYSIESSQYNEGCTRHAEIDVPKFVNENPTTVSAKIFDCMKDLHGTEVKITGLRIQKTPGKETDLKEKLATIYYHFMRSGKLKLTLNQIPIHYEMPQFRKKENGGSYFADINSDFQAGDCKYKITGWVGILPKGDQTKTGFNLVQANRVIQLGYKPEKIFGKGNSFQSSRMIGEIVFEGDHTIVSFSKDQFVWSDNGAEDAFINKLLSLDGVVEIIKACKSLKKEMNHQQIQQRTYQQLNPDIIETADNENKNKPEDTNNAPNAQEDGKTNLTDSTTDAVDPSMIDPANNYQKLLVNIEDKKVSLYSDVYAGKRTEDWLKLERYKDGFLLHINYLNAYIADKYTTQKAIIDSNDMAIVICTSVLTAQGYGLKLSDANIFINSLNSIMKGKAEQNE